MLIAFSYLKTVNGSLINIQCPISSKVPTRVPFIALLVILIFSNRLTRSSLNSYKFCSFQKDPVLQEDWKSTVCLGSKMSPMTSRTLLSEGQCPLLRFHTSLSCRDSLPVSYLFLPISAPSFFPPSFLLSLFLLFIFHSPFHFLNFPCSFPSHSPSLILHLLFLYF